MIRQIPVQYFPAVYRFKLRISRFQGPQTVWSIKFFKYRVYYHSFFVRFKHGKRHGHCPYLITPDLRVRLRSRHHIFQAVMLFHPELFFKGSSGPFCGRIILVRILPVCTLVREQPRTLSHYSERIIPVGVDLHRFPVPRRRQDLTYPDVHPRHLVQSASRCDKPVIIHPDIIIRPPHIVFNDPLHDRIHLSCKCQIPGGFIV